MPLLLNPFARDGYFGRLSEAFGWRYVLVVMITYGLNQGGLSYWGRQGRAFYFRDAAPTGIELTPAEALIVENFGKLPWDLKALFGLFSDAFAIRGYHRTPYVLLAAIFGFIGWGLLGVLEQPSGGLVTILVILGNVSIAMPDVMIDATVAAKCRGNPIHAVDLQSLGWSSIYFTSILFPLGFGPMYEAFGGAKMIFLVCLVFPPMLFFPVLFGWLSEEKDENPEKPRREFVEIMKNALSCGSYVPAELEDDNASDNPKAAIKDVEEGEHSFSKRDEYLKFGKLYLLALIICVIVVVAGTMLSEFNGTPTITVPILVACVVAICSALYFLMGPITTDLAFGAMYIFLRGAIVPLGGSTLLFWNTNTSEPKEVYDDLGRPNDYNQCGDLPENYTTVVSEDNSTWGTLNRPCLSATFVTSIDSLGGAMGLVGIMLYNKFLSHWSYRKIFMATALLGFIFSFLDWVWVSRTNVTLGIPDEFMRLFGDEIVAEIIYNWDTVPMFVMAAKLCPKGLEATLFALLMGLSNFGRTIASYSGSIIVGAFEISQKQGFDNLETWILVRNFANVAVILMIPLLVPHGSPQDKSIYEDDSAMTDEDEIERRASLVEEKAKQEAAVRTSLTPFDQ